MFYIISITSTSLSAIGPFTSETKATAYGEKNIPDPRWNVVKDFYPADYGMVNEENVDHPFFCVPVTIPN
jgi:acetone carboxylase gamma subunit